MTLHADSSGMTRRDAIAAGLAATGMLLAGRTLVARPTGSTGLAEGDYGPFKMGLQSYSLRGLTNQGHADLKRAGRDQGTGGALLGSVPRPCSLDR